MAIRAVLFDRDGTLTDLDKTWGEALTQVLYNLADGDHQLAAELGDLTGFDYAERRCRPDSMIIVSSPPQYAAIWAEHLGAPADEVFFARVEDIMQEEGIRSVTPFPDTVSCLQAIADMGLPIGLATNGTEESARLQLEKIGVLHLFDFIAGYDSGHGRKPAPGQLLAFAKQCGFAPEEIAMVGDSLHDMHAAHNAGMLRIAVTTGALSRDELVGDSDHCTETLSEVAGYIQAVRLDIQSPAIAV
ncbi:HAD family hydrolase [Pseudovibrio flavus]|uniref:HAD family hydrolase n=1 Tax=Pseudovibrio flavus TaxID=2529854 RepID=UPI00211CFA02|nr:HAD family hydrolase [Pseudovibrio flavus]